METKIINGACRFCGQTKMIELTEDEWLKWIAETNKKPQTLADEHATRTCNCKEGYEYRTKEETVRICRDNINAMYGEDFPEVEKILLEAAPLVYGGEKIKRVNVIMPDGGGVAALSFGKTGLKIEHKKTLHAEISTGF